MEPAEKALHRPAADTQARLQQFFNEELDNDSVCGTEVRDCWAIMSCFMFIFVTESLPH